MPTVFAPFIVNASTVIGEGDASIAEQLFERMKADPLQGRVGMTLDARLAKAAQAHCEDCLRRGYFSHMTPEGVWSNKRVRLTGYKLPDWYADNLNYVESIGGGYETVEEVWAAWLDSPDHRTHVLGLIPFYAEQVNVGVGYAALDGAPLFDFVWGLVSAPLEVT